MSSGLIDSIFVGNYVNQNSLGAINIVSPFFSYLFGAALMFSTGGAVRTGKYIGEDKLDDARKMFTKTFIALTIISVLLSAVAFLFTEDVARLMGANDELVPISVEYLSIVSLFGPIMTAAYAFTVFIRIDGNPLFASSSIIIFAILKVLFSALFVIALDYGVAGAAYSNAVANIIFFMIVIYHFLAKKGKLWFVKPGGNYKEIFLSAYNGISEFISEISAGIIMMTFNIIMVKNFDTDGVTAFTATNYMLFLVAMIGYAGADAASSLISVNYGAKRFDRINKFLRLTNGFLLCTGVIAFVILTLIPFYLIRLFLPDTSSDAFAIALEFTSYIRWAFLFIGINMVFSAFFTALHRPLESGIISILRGLVLPISLLFLLPKLIGDIGIFLAIPIAEVITLTVALYLYNLNKKHFKID